MTTNDIIECRHCGRQIVNDNGAWIDPNATDDDGVWREVCDSHDTFTAEHEPLLHDPARDRRSELAAELNDTQTHTPGPWEVVFRNGCGDLGGPNAYVENERWRHNIGDMDQDHADARLIAAAPDLLAACRKATDHIAAWRDGSDEHDGLNLEEVIYCVLEPAIRKATGTTS